MKSLEPLFTVAMLIALIAPLALGCSSPPPSGSTITISYSSDILTLDPQNTTDANTDQVTYQIYEPLVQIGRDGKFEPVLAESWQVVDDTTWKFNLRKSVKFHNGEEFNAETVKFNVERLADSKEQVSRGGTFRQYIAETVVQDPNTVIIKTKTPYAPFLSILGTVARMIPSKYYKEVGKDRFAKEPNGTGPYKFVSWEKDVKVTLEANDSYWRGKPSIAKFIYRPIPDDSARIAALVKGEIDYAAGVPLERAKEIESGKDTRIATRPGQVVYLGLDTLKIEPFKDKRVRQAMNHAIDVDTIIKDVLGGQATRLTAPMFPMQPGYDSSLKPYPYDPERAKKLLADAGYPNGFEVGLDVPVGYQGMLKIKEVAEATANYLGKVGIRAKLNVMEAAAAQARYNNKQFQLYFFAWGVDPPSGRITEGVISSKARGWYYINADADKLVEAYMLTVDAKKREEIGLAVQKFLHDDAPFAFLYEENEIIGLNKKVVWEPIQSDNRLRAYEFKLK